MRLRLPPKLASLAPPGGASPRADGTRNRKYQSEQNYHSNHNCDDGYSAHFFHTSYSIGVMEDLYPLRRGRNFGPNGRASGTSCANAMPRQEGGTSGSGRRGREITSWRS